MSRVSVYRPRRRTCDGRPGPASSMSTIRMFGASAGRRRGSTRRLYTDSCIVRPVMLADRVGGNGSTSCDGSFGNAIGAPAVTLCELMLPPGVTRRRSRPTTCDGDHHVSESTNDGEQTGYRRSRETAIRECHTGMTVTRIVRVHESSRGRRTPEMSQVARNVGASLRTDRHQAVQHVHRRELHTIERGSICSA